MAGDGNYNAWVWQHDLQLAQATISSDLKHLNSLLAEELCRAQEQNDWIRNATQTLTDLHKRLRLEQEVRRAAEHREQALKEEVAMLQGILQQRQSYNDRHERTTTATPDPFTHQPIGHATDGFQGSTSARPHPLSQSTAATHNTAS